MPRSRFVPVKTTDDLLALRSDVYRLLGDGRVEAVAEPPYIALDPAYFKRIGDFEARFPPARPRCADARASSSAATSRSGAASWRAGASRSAPTSRTTRP